MNYHPIAIKAAAKELVCRSPEVQTKATIVELTEPLDDEFAVGIEVARPLLEGEEIAVAVVADFQNMELCPGKLVEKVMQDQKGVVPWINVLHHERRQLVLLGAGAAVKKDIPTRLQQRPELGQHPVVLGQMLDHSHDDDGIVFPIRLIRQQIGVDQLPVMAEFLRPSVQVVDRALRDG